MIISHTQPVFSKLKLTCLSGKCLAALLLSAFSTPAAIAQYADLNITTTQSGIHNGFYYNVWKDSGNINFGLREAGRYTSQWSNINNWIGGIGWNPGSRDKVVKYSGNFNITDAQNAYLTLYGWTTDPYVEYYIVESYGSYKPYCAQTFGTIESDGATYEISRCRRPEFGINPLQIHQYFSVRIPKKGYGAVSGTITVANHFDAWAANGMTLGKHDYMILATEGYQSMGSSDITVVDATEPRHCGKLDDVPVCCHISADPDGDGIGFQNNGEACVVTENTEGWEPSSSSSSSSSNSSSSSSTSASSSSNSSSSSSTSSSGSGSTNTGGGSVGWWFLLMISGLLGLPRRS